MYMLVMDVQLAKSASDDDHWSLACWMSRVRLRQVISYCSFNVQMC